MKVQLSKRSSAIDHTKDSSAGTFVKKLFNMVTNEPDDVIRWIKDGTAFFISDTKRLSESHIPKYFRHGKFSSLIRQLNFYSFYKMQEGGQSIVYRHSFFREGRPDLLENIRRRGSGKAKDPLFDPLEEQPVGGSPTRPSAASPKINSLTTPNRAPLSSPAPRAKLNLDRMSPTHKFGLAPASMPPVLKLGPGAAVTLNANVQSISVGGKTKRVFDQVSSDNRANNKPAVPRESAGLGLKNIFAIEDYQLGQDLGFSAKPLSVAYLSRDCFNLESDMTNAQRQDTEEALLLTSLDEADSLWERPLSPLNLPDQSMWLDSAF